MERRLEASLEASKPPDEIVAVGGQGSAASRVATARARHELPPESPRGVIEIREGMPVRPSDARGTGANGSRFLDRQEKADPSVAEGERAPALQPHLPTCDEPM